MGSPEFASLAKMDPCQVPKAGLINTKFIKGLYITPRGLSGSGGEGSAERGSPSSLAIGLNERDNFRLH